MQQESKMKVLFQRKLIAILYGIKNMYSQGTPPEGHVNSTVPVGTVAVTTVAPNIRDKCNCILKVSIFLNSQVVVEFIFAETAAASRAIRIANFNN